MKQTMIFFAFLILSVTGLAQSGMLWDRYYISGSLAVGRGDRLFADSSAWLQLGKDTTKKGLLLPRVLLDSISTTKRGLFVYDLKDSVLYHFDGNKRVRYMTYKDTNTIKQLFKPYLVTDSITEGVNNKYFTDVRARAALSAGTGISYNSTTGVIGNSGVLSVDGSAGAVSLTNTYHKQGGNAFATTSTIGTTTNFGINFITNNTTKFSLSNTGQGIFTGSTVEDVLTVGSSGKTNKIIMGIGRGSQVSDNFSFILLGSNFSVDPIIAATSNGSNRIDISRVSTINVLGPSGNTAEIRGAMNGSSTGSVIGIGSNANGAGGGHTGTSGVLNWLLIPWHIGANSDINPTSGNMEVNVINIDPKVNQTGTANGTVRGIYINPTITSAPDFRAIGMSNNTGYGIYQSGAGAKNYFNGNVGIKITNPSEALEVGGNIKTAQPSANGAGAVKLGKVITGASVTVQTDKYLEVEIDGVIRKLAIVQ